MVILLVIIADQALKIWVKTHFYLGEDYRITDWFQIYFIENNGMAFGMELGSKLLLTLVRIVAVAALIWIICRIHRDERYTVGFMVTLALITAGAAGNIIDCVFYGEIFNNPPPPEVAQLFPPDGGYGTWLHGRVVDMLYFPLCSWDWPSWMPWIGGKHFIFFQPVFNLADAAITVGMFIFIFFYTRYLSPVKEENKDAGKEDSRMNECTSEQVNDSQRVNE